MTAKTQTDAAQDFAKSFTMFDPSKMVEQFSKMVGDYKFGTVDMTPFVEIQRKNLEVLVAANKLAAEGMQSVYKTQTELQKKAADEFSGTVNTVTKAASPQEAVAAQAELFKNSYGKAIANMVELNDMMVKNNREVMGKINGRVAESLDEFKTEVLKIK